jgi:hypothetical protein
VNRVVDTAEPILALGLDQQDAEGLVAEWVPGDEGVGGPDRLLVLSLAEQLEDTAPVDGPGGSTRRRVAGRRLRLDLGMRAGAEDEDGGNEGNQRSGHIPHMAYAGGRAEAASGRKPAV